MQQDFARKRRGRPPAPPGEARTHRVVTFVNDAQFSRLRSLASEADATLSSTLYSLLCQQLNSPTQHND